MHKLLTLGSNVRRMLEELHFNPEEWEEITVDINPDTNPDIVGDIRELDKLVEKGTIDFIVANHVIEHIADWELIPLFESINRALKLNGKFMVNCPDMEAVASAIIKTGSLRTVLYEAQAGKIRTIDMIHGYQIYVRQWPEMRHLTGFTELDLRMLCGLASLNLIQTFRNKVDLGLITIFEKVYELPTEE